MAVAQQQAQADLLYQLTGKGEFVMPGLIVVTHEMLEEAEAEGGDPFTEIPRLQEMMEGLEEWAAAENARRDAAHAERQASGQIEEG